MQASIPDAHCHLDLIPEPERAIEPPKTEADPDIAPPPAPAREAPREATPSSSTPPAEIPRLVATDMLQPSRFAALASPKEDDIQAALDKWRASGMLEPLLVRAKSGAPGHFEIISGIDRWHAARRAYVRQIPVIAREASDQEALEQGVEPSVLEEALDHRRMARPHG